MSNFLCNVEFNQVELQNPVLQNLAAAPGTPLEGQFYYNTVSNRMEYWDGTAWQSPGSETALTLTTDGNATGVTLSGTSNHTANIVLLSTDANNSLSSGGDGGLFYNDPVSGVTDQANGLDLISNAGNIEVSYDFTELTVLSDAALATNDLFLVYNNSASAHESATITNIAGALISADANNILVQGTDNLLLVNPVDQSVVADITARDALGDLTSGDIAYVIDASADANVASGAALYVYDGAAWQLIAEFESINSATSVVTPQAQAGALSGRTIATHNDGITGSTNVNIQETVTTAVLSATNGTVNDTLTITSEDNTSTVATLLREVKQNITTVGGVALNVTHNLGNTTPTVTLWQGGTKVEACVSVVDGNTISVLTNQAQTLDVTIVG